MVVGLGLVQNLQLVERQTLQPQQTIVGSVIQLDSYFVNWFKILFKPQALKSKYSVVCVMNVW